MNLAAENARLRAENEQLRTQMREQVTAALATIEQLQMRVQELEARLKQDSHNSHWPPSRDTGRQTKTRSLRQRSGKKPGGQAGHAGETLKMVAEADAVIVHRPQACAACGRSLQDATEAAEESERRQVFDLPPLRLVVTEHRVANVSCPACQARSRGEFPAEAAQAVQYGPRVKGLGVYLHHQHLLPVARVSQVLGDLFGAAPSAGSIIHWRQAAGEQVRETVAQIVEQLRQVKVLHCDESGLYVGGARVWVHVACTPHLSCYGVHAKRGQPGIDALGVLPHFRGTAVHDGWTPYALYDCRHALCNVHHLRDLTYAHEELGQGWAEEFMRFLLEVKAQVEQAKAQGATTLPPDQRLAIDRRYQQLVDEALHATSPPAGGWPRGKRGRERKSKARNLAERLERHRPQILTFADDFAVPFDNNLAERDIRMLKVQQKISGCFRSWDGAHAACRLRSYLSTLGKQGHDAFTLLVALFAGHPPPQLLPTE